MAQKVAHYCLSISFNKTDSKRMRQNSVQAVYNSKSKVSSYSEYNEMGFRHVIR